MSLTNRPRLGRGLKSLLSTPAPEPVIVNVADVRPVAAGSPPLPEGPESLKVIPLVKIDANPNQPRQAMDPAALGELVASIKANGILQPVVVKPAGDRYQLIAGHRRTEAARKAGLQEITVIVRADSTEEKQAEWALIENIHRADLNAIERAKAYKAYLAKFNFTHAQGAQRLGEDRTTITNFMRLLDLNAGVQDLVARGLLSAGHAKVLAGVAEGARQDALANRCVAENLSVRKLEELAAMSQDVPASETTVAGHTRALAAKSAHILDLEQELSRKLGTKLRIQPSKKKNSGRILIQYFSLDEFDRIVECFEHATVKKPGHEAS
jgi:ParB family transcriptional regulator, chromosome partitioning protein